MGTLNPQRIGKIAISKLPLKQQVSKLTHDFANVLEEAEVEDNRRMDVKLLQEEMRKSVQQKTDLPKNGVESPKSWENCDFETVIEAAGYGKYNVMIMAYSVFPMLSCLFATSTISLILPSAECDLHLSNLHKGTLNAVTYIGMICSAFFWGFLSDTLGRQKLLVIGFFLDFVLNLSAGLAQSYEVLLASKLMAGFICSGPFAILMTYLAECHSAEHRAQLIQWTGVFSAVGTVGLPLLAWGIIPQPWELDIIGLNLPSWRIFMVICTLPAVVSTITLYFQLESPKFLMSRGRNDEAMEAFRAIYAINSGQPGSSYPVRSLLNEKKLSEKVEEDLDEDNKSVLRFVKLGWVQIKPLFIPPYLRNAILVFLFQGCSLFGLNTLRLWMPQLFSSILRNEHLAENATSVCDVLVSSSNQELNCTAVQVDGEVYKNVVIVGIATAVSYLISGYVIKLVGKKILIIWCCLLAAGCSCAMYWSTSLTMMMIISSGFISIVSVSTTAIISVVVDLFPTSLRSMAVSLTMMIGRFGAMVGNLLFPVLLDLNCTVPFFLIAAVLIGAMLITLMIPKTKGKALE